MPVSTQYNAILEGLGLATPRSVLRIGSHFNITLQTGMSELTSGDSQKPADKKSKKNDTEKEFTKFESILEYDNVLVVQEYNPDQMMAVLT